MEGPFYANYMDWYRDAVGVNSGRKRSTENYPDWTKYGMREPGFAPPEWALRTPKSALDEGKYGPWIGNDPPEPGEEYLTTFKLGPFWLIAKVREGDSNWMEKQPGMFKQEKKAIAAAKAIAGKLKVRNQAGDLV